MSAQNSDDHDLLREQIQSAIAAGRDLGPDMDKHLADSVLAQYTKERAARDKALAKVQGTSMPVVPSSAGHAIESFFRGVVSLAVIAALIVALVMTQGKAFFLLFFIGPVLGGMWGGWGRHHSRRYAYSSANGSANDDELRQQERATRRRLKIQHMEAEISRLKRQRENEYD